MGLLRDVRARAQKLQECLNEIRKTFQLKDTDARALESGLAVEESLLTFQRNNDGMRQNLADIRALFDANAESYCWCGDWVVFIENDWADVQAHWPVPGQDPDEWQRRMDISNQHLDEIIYHCASLTVAERVGSKMENLRVGQALRFDEQFADELPNPEHRKRVLHELACEPGAVEGGVVDEDFGIIYRAAANPRSQRASVYRIVLAVLLAIFVVPSAFYYARQQMSSAAGNLENLMVAFLAIQMGSVAHVLINAVKEYRSRGSLGLVAIGDWILWLHVRETSILFGILYVAIGFLGLAWTNPDLNWLTAFFAGYSIDSIIDLILPKFDKLAARKAAEAQGSL